MKFLNTPNLPSGRVRVAAIGSAYPAIHNVLETIGIQCVYIQKHKRLQDPVSCHADMILHHLGENNILAAKGEVHTFLELQRLGFRCEYISSLLDSIYPNDVLLNACRIGNLLLCNTKVISREILDYCNKNKIEVEHVNQGYTKCSVCVINENAVITADQAIARICRNNNIDVLEIHPGNIILEGLSYGFIGGCCGLIDKNLIAFTGNIEAHPDGASIKSFLNSYDMEYISLLNSELIDIGGILPLMEE